jgi:hypothetical protein
VGKVWAELASYKELFTALAEQIVEVNEAICEAWLVPPSAGDPLAGPAGKRGLREALAAEIAAEVAALGVLAARLLAAGNGLEPAELAIRTAMLRLGGRLLEDVLGINSGHRGPRMDCGAGRQAEFASCRAKTVDTVVGPVQVR